MSMMRRHIGGRMAAEQETATQAWRRRIIAVTFVCEAVACLNRRNLSMSSTLMATQQDGASAEGSNHTGADDSAAGSKMSEEMLGELATVAALAYAVAKPLHSLLSDYVSSAKQLGYSLVGTGLCNIMLGLTTSRSVFLWVMALNGFLQGGVFPAIARLLIAWFPERVRGSYWSVVAMASNFGYGAMPVLVTMVMQRVGSWRVAFFLPGLMAAIAGMLVPALVLDSPVAADLPAVESVAATSLAAAGGSILRVDDDAGGKRKAGGGEGTGSGGGGGGGGGSQEWRAAVLCRGRAAVSLWLVASAIGCLFFVFRGFSTWGQLWLVDARGYSPVLATSTYSLVELGGLLGAGMAGPLTDRYTDRATLSLGSLLVMAMLLSSESVTRWGLPASVGLGMDLRLMLLGVCIGVPKVSLPLLARSELLPLSVVGLSGAVVDLMGEVGGTCSGFAIGSALGRAAAAHQPPPHAHALAAAAAAPPQMAHHHHHVERRQLLPNLASASAAAGTAAEAAAAAGAGEAAVHGGGGDGGAHRAGGGEGWEEAMALFCHAAMCGALLVVLFLLIRTPPPGKGRR